MFFLEYIKILPYIPRQIINTWFCIKSHTPNLRDIFPSISPKKLTRNSSAIWDDECQFSMFVPSNSFTEEEDEDDY